VSRHVAGVVAGLRAIRSRAVNMFDVATLALGILGFGTGVASLTWNVVAFLWTHTDRRLPIRPRARVH